MRITSGHLCELPENHDDTHLCYCGAQWADWENNIPTAWRVILRQGQPIHVRPPTAHACRRKRVKP
jgi:hypothetical protein